MQNNKLYVGNLNFETSEDDLKKLFSAHGTVNEINVMERKGFGFVTMGTPEEALKAKEALNGIDVLGRKIRVDEARPPREKGGGGGNKGFRR